MTNKTQALGRRLIGALRNEDVLSVVSTSTGMVTLVNARTGKAFYSGYVFNGEEDFPGLVRYIKSLPGYPAAKDRQPRMVVKTHGAPKYVGISMGSFKPGNMSLDF